MFLGIAMLACVVVLSFAYVRGQRELGRPLRRERQAVSLLERVLAADDVLPSLPTDLSIEARNFVDAYYKELNR